MATLFMVGVAIAQAPQAIPYQAAARNNNGVVFANKSVALRFSVREATAIGTIVYQETQNAVTNALGLFMVNIGQGNVLTGKFSNINWSLNAKFIQVELDTTGTGCCYTTIGTQQLMSVPYALSAKRADTATVATHASDGVPPGTIIAFAGDTGHVPNGWLLCDGQGLSTTDPKYAALYAAIGTNWGSTGSGIFNLPYTWGLFFRGCTNGHPSSDPESGSRTEVQKGGNTGDKVGSYQDDAFRAHSHDVISNNNPPDGRGDGFLPTIGSRINNHPTSSVGGLETRPKNVYVNYIIKY